MERCPWCLGNEKLTRYHDEEWGIPLHDDYKQFEFLMLEVMQCGLNWNMMLQKREVFRQCFADFDFDKIAAFQAADVERILHTPGMIQSPRKVNAVIQNSRCVQAIRQEYGSFSDYLWGLCGGKTICYVGHEQGRMPAQNALSVRVSAALKKCGMKYLGPVTVYAHLQACGIINDHLSSCSRYAWINAQYPTCVREPENEK